MAWLSAAPGRTATADYPIRPVPFTAVRVADAFWTPRIETNRLTTVWYDFRKCEETGRIDNFARAAGLKPGPFQGCPFDDSDVYKVIQGAACTLATHPDPELDAYLDRLIATLAAAQEPDRYLYTARTLKSGHSRAGRDLTLIPYYAWCHRGPNEMRVWIPVASVPPPAPPH